MGHTLIPYCTVCKRVTKHREPTEWDRDQFQADHPDVLIHWHRIVCRACHDREKPGILARMRGICDEGSEMETCGVEG